MRVGYLHIGPPDHGVYRLGVLLAAEARKRPSLTVVEATVTLTGDSKSDRAQIVGAARRLADTDVVHLQYNSQREKCVWGAGWRQLYHLWLFARVCGRPFVVQVCDFYPRQAPRDLLRLVPAQLAGLLAAARGRVSSTPVDAPTNTRAPLSAIRKQIRNTFGPVGTSVRWLSQRAQLLLVCASEEERRLRAFVPNGRIRLIPLFVEERTLSVSNTEAKARLGFSNRTVLTLLGYIHPRKGHKLLLEALSDLPEEYVVIFAGQAREQSTLRDLLACARTYGVADRVRMTGYLPEEQLNDYLAATDVAVCPFEDVAGSSSLSTWISAERPILASDLPLIAEYNAVSPGAIRTFSPRTSGALSLAIRDMTETRRQDVAATAHLRSTLGIGKIFDLHVSAYTHALSSAFASGVGKQPIPGPVQQA